MDQFTENCEKLRAQSRSNDNLTSMDHQVLHLDSNNVAFLADALFANKNHVPVLSLDLSLLTGQARGLDRLLKFVGTSECLHDVRLLGSEYSRSIALNSVVNRFLQAFHKNHHAIERLTLHNVGLDADSFARLVRHSRTLSYLCLNGCCVTTDGKNRLHSMTKVGAAFEANTCIQSIRLVELEEDLLNTILAPLQSHQPLRKLDVAYGSVASAEAIGEVVGSPRTPFLHHLVLRDSSLISLEPIVRAVMRKRTPLQKLELHNCDLDSVSAALLRSLFRSKHQTIEDVSLCDLDVEDESNLQDLFAGIGRSPTICKLKIHHIPGVLEAAGFAALVRMLRSNLHLKHVNLDRKILKAIGLYSSSDAILDPAVSNNDKGNTALVFSRQTGSGTAAFRRIISNPTTATTTTTADSAIRKKAHHTL